MDIFDGARVVARWWFVSVPILLLTVMGALFVTRDIQPEYTAEGSVLLLGPAVRESDNQPGEFDTLNPLLDQPSALETVAIVVALSIEGPEVVNLLAEEGLSTAFALGTNRGVPIVLLEVRADSRSTALQTAERLAELIDEEVRLRQVAGDVPENERVTTSIVQLGAVGGADYGARTRVRILIGALGLGTAFGAAFLLEGLKRRRAATAQRRDSNAFVGEPGDEATRKLDSSKEPEASRASESSEHQVIDRDEGAAQDTPSHEVGDDDAEDDDEDDDDDDDDAGDNDAPVERQTEDASDDTRQHEVTDDARTSR